MVRLVHITTLPQTAASFLSGQLSWLSNRDFDVTVIASPGPQLAEFAHQEGIDWRAVPMNRAISPLHDVRAIHKLTGQLREIAPQIVHAHTPKAGLLGMVAARLAGVPINIYQLHGLRFETVCGWRRELLRSAERLTCRLAHRVLCVSPSLRQRGLTEGLFTADKSMVLARGSVNGLDVAQFVGSDDLDPLRQETRHHLRIPPDALCLGFVGRLVRDKGILELHAAWQQLRQEFPKLHLLLVGPFEAGDSVPRSTQRQLLADPRVHMTGLDWNTRGYYAAMDVFTLPTHREGLGHVLLEAGAMGLAVVSCQVTGCVDAVVPNKTGTLVPARDPAALRTAIANYLRDAQLRQAHGQAAREWVCHQFAPRPIWEALEREYRRLLRIRCPHVTAWSSSDNEEFRDSPAWEFGTRLGVKHPRRAA